MSRKLLYLLVLTAVAASVAVGASIKQADADSCPYYKAVLRLCAQAIDGPSDVEDTLALLAAEGALEGTQAPLPTAGSGSQTTLAFSGASSRAVGMIGFLLVGLGASVRGVSRSSQPRGGSAARESP